MSDASLKPDATGDEHLLDDALDYLASLRLVRQRPEGALPLPAIARYRVATEEPES